MTSDAIEQAIKTPRRRLRRVCETVGDREGMELNRECSEAITDLRRHQAANSQAPVPQEHNPAPGPKLAA